MHRLIKSEWKKIGLPVLLTTLLFTMAASVLTATLYRSYSLVYTLDAWEIGTEIFGVIYLLMVVIPLCWNLHQERKNNFLLYVQPRVSVRSYLGAKWMVYAFGAFCIIAVPYLVSAATSLLIDPPLNLLNRGAAVYFIETVYVQQPVLYAAGLSCWKGMIGILVMTMGFVLAMYCDNVFVVLTGPFVYTVLENFVLSILRIPQYRLVTAFEPSCLSPAVISAKSFVIGPMLLIGCTVLLAVFFCKIKKTRVINA